MKGIDLAVIALIVALLTATAIYHVRRRRRGESSCPCCDKRDHCSRDKR